MDVDKTHQLYIILGKLYWYSTQSLILCVWMIWIIWYILTNC